MITDPKEIKDWLDKMGIKNYTIRPDGIVDVDSKVNLRFKPISSIPVQFGRVNGPFILSHTEVSSLECLPSVIDGGFYSFNTNLKSLSGIHEVIKQMDGIFVCTDGATHLLGLLLVDGITVIGTESEQVNDILNSHLVDKDIISAQDELIDAGFKEQAKL